MNECITDALVIDREESGEQDARVFLYTEALGSVVAKATSIRKITSKLATHLEPLNFVKVRLIERGGGGSVGYQIGDALLTHRSNAWRASPEALRNALELIAVFRESGFRGDPDVALWRFLVSMFCNLPAAPFPLYVEQLLSVLGFDSRYATCGNCASAHLAQFSFSAMAFFCAVCATKRSATSTGVAAQRDWQLAERRVIRLS